MSICGDLLRQWCGKLLELQVRSVDNPALKGGILCPACAGIHGRCFDAVYPFLYLADVDQDDRYLEGAKLLFDWAEQTVSREDGSYVNDTNSEWKGTTVFSVIQLIEALENHGHILDQDTYQKWKARIGKAAEFLCGFKTFEVCNVNYRITNSLAMYLCGTFLGEDRYIRRANELAALAAGQITENGILIGEGRPVDGYSAKGCRPVDIGYNLEESLPSFIQYAYLVGDEELKKTVRKALKRHLLFFLEDGGIDNSFGTRNFKWTYWGSRTSDGCALGYLLGADEEPEFGIAAYKSLKQLEKCTHNGFLYGGPHVWESGEPPCVHHAFSHAKVLAGILDRGLENRLSDGILPRQELKHPVYLNETDTYLVTKEGYTATVTGYDWEYIKLPGGHASGGSLSLLWQKKAGLVLCGSMCDYNMKEANNMQLPRFSRHECLTPRLEFVDGEKVYSSMYDYGCRLFCEDVGQGVEPQMGQAAGQRIGQGADPKMDRQTIVRAEGWLTDIGQNRLPGDDGNYRMEYWFGKNFVRVSAAVGAGAKWVLPLVSERHETVIKEEKSVLIRKDKTDVKVEVIKGTLTLPYEMERIYNLVPGVEALKAEIEPEDGEIAFCFSF